jgi:2-keto-4-pentenoate hydratase/2-oxohepta-3-ene-1,7-dioic acid hydratase in catechol pathway
MPRWCRFEHQQQIFFGQVHGDAVHVFAGNSCFEASTASGQILQLASVRLLMPCVPSKLIGLWNNFHALAQKLNQPIPAHPLYFIKTPNSYAGFGDAITPPANYNGNVFYEGELAIVIGKRVRNANLEQARATIFGYACINDVTAFDLLHQDASFAQWTRAKSFDGFAPFGPWIDTEFDPASASVFTRVNGKERQNYPISDMVFSPVEIVQRISQDMTLEPGDVIACGTSLGALPMREGCEVEVEVSGLGILKNTFGTKAAA